MSRVCSREGEVLEALGRGALAGGLEQHAKACEVCADLVLVEAALAHEVRRVDEAGAPPEVGAVWWRLERRLREERLERALRPIRWARRVAIAATTSAVGLVAFLWVRGRLPGLMSLDGSAVVEWLSAESAIAAASLAIVFVLVLFTADRWVLED